MIRMPKQKPGNSRQCYRTPTEFINAVEDRFGTLTFDLAATEKNAIAEEYFTRRTNALAKNTIWPRSGNIWLNPPFLRIDPWIKRVCQHSHVLKPKSRILVLLPAGVGTNWFWEWVWQKANVEVLKPRLSFSSKGPYPKDLILCTYPKVKTLPDLSRWVWK